MIELSAYGRYQRSSRASEIVDESQWWAAAICMPRDRLRFPREREKYYRTRMCVFGKWSIISAFVFAVVGAPEGSATASLLRQQAPRAADTNAGLPASTAPTERDGLPPLWKDVFEVAAWAVAIVAGIITAATAVGESRANREQRERSLLEAREGRDQRARELRWRQAQIGSQLVSEMLEESLAWDAMQMLDWERLELTIRGEAVPISIGEVLHALRPRRDASGSVEKRIRDAFDALFHQMARLEQSVTIGLTTLDDISLPIEYYVGRMAEHQSVHEAYMREFGHQGALHLARRFQSWSEATRRASRPEL